MSKLTPPSPKNLKKRLQFFLDNPTYKKARWEVFNIKNQLINRDFQNRLINQDEYNSLMDELDRTQGLFEEEPCVFEVVDKNGSKVSK